MGVRDDSAHYSRHKADPGPVGRGRLGARPSSSRTRWKRPCSILEEGEAVTMSTPAHTTGSTETAASGAPVSAVEQRLAELGIRLPDVAAPVAAYVPAIISGNHVYTSGQLPFINGKLEATGKVSSGDEGHSDEPTIAPEDAKQLAAVCAVNALAAVKSVIGDLDRITRIVKVVGFVSSDPSFTGQPGV